MEHRMAELKWKANIESASKKDYNNRTPDSLVKIYLSHFRGVFISIFTNIWQNKVVNSYLKLGSWNSKQRDSVFNVF